MNVHKRIHTHTHIVALSPWPQLKRQKRNRRHSQFVKRSGSLEIEMVTRPTQPAVTGSHLQVGGREQVDIQSNFNWV